MEYRSESTAGYSSSGMSGTTFNDRFVTGEETPEQLVDKFESWFQVSQPLHEKRLEWCDKNKKSYLGDQVPNKGKRASWRSDTVYNKQFENIESIVPIMTENVPVPLAAVPGNDTETLKAARGVEALVKYIYRIDKLKTKSAIIARNMMLHRDAIVSPYWDPSKGKNGEITIEVLSPKQVRIDPNATFESQGDFAFKIVDRNFRQLASLYPEKIDELKEAFGVNTASGMDSGDQPKDPAALLPLKEVWYWQQDEGEAEFCIYRSAYLCGNGKRVLLDTSKNPYWDEEGEITDPEVLQKVQADISLAQQNARLQGKTLSESDIDAIEEKYEDMKRYKNFLEKPEFPVIMFQTYPDTDSPYSITSTIEQTHPLQKSLNKRKQQIDENANLMTNGVWIVDKNSGVEDYQLTNAPGAIIKKNVGSEVRRENGVPLPGQMFEDKADTERAIDNIFGGHDISKGQQTGVKTFGEAQLLKQADRGRIALQIRQFEESMEHVYKWIVHLAKLFYTEERQIAIFNSVGQAESYATISSDKIPDNMQLFVQVGSARPIDQEAKRQEALDFYKEGLLDPETALDRMGDFPDAKEIAERAWKYKSGQLFEQPQASIEDQARQENEMILANKRVQPNQQANRTHVMIHQELLGDKTKPLTDDQIKALEALMQAELGAVDAKEQKQSELQIPQDILQALGGGAEQQMMPMQ